MEGSTQVKSQGQGRRRNNFNRNNKGRHNNNNNQNNNQNDGGEGSSKSNDNTPHSKEPKPIQAKLKVLVRNLPPTLTEETFRKQVDEKFQDEYSWLRFWAGKQAVKGREHPVLSRCYLRFKTEDTVMSFCKEFQGHAYINDKGVRFLASVQFAPYQKCPRAKQGKRGRDLKQNSIHKDADYKRFVAELERTAGVVRPSADVQLDQKEAEQKALLASTGATQPAVAMTPLMTYMQKKANVRAAKRQRQQAANRKAKEKHQKKGNKGSSRKNKSNSSSTKSRKEGKKHKEMVKIKARSSNSNATNTNTTTDANAWTTVITRKSGNNNNNKQGSGKTRQSSSSGDQHQQQASSGGRKQRGGSSGRYRKGKGNAN